MIKVAKSQQSKIEIKKDFDRINISIPQDKSGMVKILISIIFLNAFGLCAWIIDKKTPSIIMVLGFTMFYSYLFLLCIKFLFMIWGRFRLTIDKHHLTAYWELFGLNYKKRCNTKNIMEIAEDTFIQDAIKYEYGIKIILRNSKYIRFTTLTGEERTWLIGKLNELIKKEDVQSGKNADEPGIGYGMKAGMIPYIGIMSMMLLMLSYFLIGMILSMREGFTANNILSTVLISIFMFFPGYGLYINLNNRPYMLVFSADEKKLVLKSFLKTTTLFVKDIKLLKVEGERIQICTLCTDNDSICFYAFEEFHEFVARLRKNNHSFTLKE